MKSWPSLLIIFFLLALVGGLTWAFWDMFEARPLPQRPEGAAMPPRVEGAAVVENPQTYENPDENFTFSYPQKFIVTEEPIDGGGKKILVESTEAKKGFEVTILPFDETGPLTLGRIARDLPEMVVENPHTVTLNSADALAFNSLDENIGPTFEIWFAWGGYLYQALTYPEFGPEMTVILQTWRFK